MLFNSVVFLGLFLPIVLVGAFFFSRLPGPNSVINFLVVASLCFYGWHRPWDLLILIPSVTLNYFAAVVIEHCQTIRRPSLARIVLTLGIAADLALIGYFKYLDFAASTVGADAPLTGGLRSLALPLGISFFTFQQIKFLVDRFRKEIAQPPFSDYALFVAFFPHVIAGPIVHHEILLPQFRGPSRSLGHASLDSFVDGATFFLLGLAKKVVLADQFGVYATTGFDASAAGHPLTFFAAWVAVLSFTLQLYFDFSGYSDMAFGLARMLGIRFPMNFDSPYQATSIIDFWRRWHMTLSQFLRDYLYIPLGGNRYGAGRRYLNIIITMALGGLWHGAGWTFVFWGALHGAYLVINHLWNALSSAFELPKRGSWLGLTSSRVITMLAVIVAWVFFRADSFDSATGIVRSMLGGNGTLLPAQFTTSLPWLSHIAEGAATVPYLADETVYGFLAAVLMLVFGYAIVSFAPNLFRMSANARFWLLVPSFAFVVQKIFFSGAPSSFIYFRF